MIFFSVFFDESTWEVSFIIIIVSLLMQTARKSFRTYSVAQNFKKEIDETLFKVELEKRKYLTLEREENYLRDNYEKKVKDFNELKAQETAMKANSSKTSQTSKEIQNLDRNHLNIHDEIQRSKQIVVTHRRQMAKYKEMNTKLQQSIQTTTLRNEEINSDNINLQVQNEQIKEQIMRFRENNLKNGMEFYQSHANIHKSNAHEENIRRKASMQQKNFLGQEMKNSKIIPFDGLSDQLRESGLKFSDHVNEIMTESLPLAKERIRAKIHQNKEKIKITENYRKFGENLETMFKVMKQYKGREDLDFIAQEFVTKERQLQKIEEYIGQLESRILKSQLILKARRKEDDVLEAEVNTRIEKKDQHYHALQKSVQEDIEQLKKEEEGFYSWFQKVSNILMPLTGQPLTRSNAPNLIGGIEQSLNPIAPELQKKLPAKSGYLPNFDLSDKQNYTELLTYQKMRQLASEYVKSKKQ